MTPIKVLIVEDSPVAIKLYQRVMESSPQIKVVGTVNDGQQALSIIPQLQPQVIVTDLEMPTMDGYDLIKQVMAKYPLPILVLSNAVQTEHIDNIFQVLQDGALDVLPKPQASSLIESDEFKSTLVTKIRVLATKTVKAKPL